jgi:hypothetical protein
MIQPNQTYEPAKWPEAPPGLSDRPGAVPAPLTHRTKHQTSSLEALDINLCELPRRIPGSSDVRSDEPVAPVFHAGDAMDTR